MPGPATAPATITATVTRARRMIGPHDGWGAVVVGAGRAFEPRPLAPAAGRAPWPSWRSDRVEVVRGGGPDGGSVVGAPFTTPAPSASFEDGGVGSNETHPAAGPR